MFSRLSWAGFVIAIGLAACSNSTSGGMGFTMNGGDVTQPCNDLAAQLCKKLNECSSFAFSLAYMDMNQCLSRLGVSCPSGAKANGSGATATALEACAQAYASADCAALVAGVAPAACNIHGSLATNAPCGSSVQCMGDNSYCNIPANQICGVCATRSGLGGPCTQTSDCNLDLACASSGMCVTPGDTGAQCNLQKPCKVSLSCVNQKCSAPVGAMGTCDPNVQNCDYAAGLFCNTSNTCIPYKVASAGAMCGLSTTSDSYTLCTGTLLCATPTMSLRGTCPPISMDGAMCDPNGLKSACLAPAVCVNGVCVLDDPSSCH
jgi:hypothetical protein